MLTLSAELPLEIYKDFQNTPPRKTLEDGILLTPRITPEGTEDGKSL